MRTILDNGPGLMRGAALERSGKHTALGNPPPSVPASVPVAEPYVLFSERKQGRVLGHSTDRTTIFVLINSGTVRLADLLEYN